MIASNEQSVRDLLEREERLVDVTHSIDPGFVNRRRIETIAGEEGRRLLDREIAKLPAQPEWQREVRIGHIYSALMLHYCRSLGARSLQEIVATRTSKLFCSTEFLGPCPYIYDGLERASNIWVPDSDHDLRVEFQYSTSHITSDTLRSQLYEGDRLSIIGELHKFYGDIAVFHPLVMGSPWLETSDPKWKEIVPWWGTCFYEHAVEDFDQFAKVLDCLKPSSCEPMKKVSEWAFKSCLAEILGGVPEKDWGGETSDFFSAHLSLGGKRLRAAFLLKGPARFRPMTLDSLGKRNDQILRLAQEPADILFVQHCHEIKPPVRTTLRAFAVQPSNPRRFCLIDGRDSLWLLRAFGLYDRAVEITKVRRAATG